MFEAWKLLRTFDGVKTSGNRLDVFVIVGLLLLTVLMSRPLFHNEVIRLGDGAFAVNKAVAMYQSWQHGDWLGRWSPDVIRGYGYPNFNYYPPLFSYVAAFLMMCRVPVFLAFNLTFVFFLFLSGCFMYLLAREFWGRAGGLLSAAAYMMAPYHIADLYVRGATAEFAGLAITPLFFWSLCRVSRAVDLKVIIVGVLSCGCLILAHSLTALLVFPAGLAYMMVLFLLRRTKGWRTLGAGAAMALGGLALSAYFWMPVMLERQYVYLERAITGQYALGQNFYPFFRLIYSPWSSGEPGASNSYMIGLVQLALTLLTVIFFRKVSGARKDAAPTVIFFTGLLLVSIFFMLKASLPVWKIFPSLAYIQFPTRFLVLSVLAVSVLAGGSLFLFHDRRKGMVLALSLAALIFSGVFYCRAFGYQKLDYRSAGEYLYASLPMDNMEMLPKWVRKVSLNSPAQKLQVWAGMAAVGRVDHRWLDSRYEINSLTPAVLAYHSYYFPGWQVSIDGKTAQINSDNQYGLIVFTVPPGSHAVRIHFGTTPVRRMAESISLSAAFVVFLLGLVLLCRAFNSRTTRFCLSASRHH